MSTMKDSQTSISYWDTSLFSVKSLVIMIVTSTLVYWMLYHKKSRDQIPGIHGMAGFIFMVGRTIKGNYTTMTERKFVEFGDIYSIRIFNFRKFILLGSHDIVREAFQKISGRAATLTKHGLINANGTLWKEQRRFALSTLRDFGMGRNMQQERINDECEDLVTAFGKHTGPLNPKYYISCAVTNIICNIIFSDRFSYEDKVLEKFFQCINENVKDRRRTILMGIPASRFLPGYGALLQRIMENRNEIQSIIKKYINEHKETYEEGCIRDYIDAFMSVQKLDDNTSFTDEQLLNSVFDLFVAGSETTGTTLHWALALMAKHPDIQALVHNDIDQNIGRDKPPTMSDKLSLKYTEAVLLEIQRFASVVPLVGRVCLEDCQVAGFHIQKGDHIHMNTLRLHRHPKVWPFPNQFRIENFLQNGELINRNAMISFSVGKRSCIGESLAKMEIFILFVALMQKFTFRFEQGEEPDFDEVRVGLIRSLAPYSIHITPRQ